MDPLAHDSVTAYCDEGVMVVAAPAPTIRPLVSAGTFWALKGTNKVVVVLNPEHGRRDGTDMVLVAPLSKDQPAKDSDLFKVGQSSFFTSRKWIRADQMFSVCSADLEVLPREQGPLDKARVKKLLDE